MLQVLSGCPRRGQITFGLSTILLLLLFIIKYKTNDRLHGIIFVRRQSCFDQFDLFAFLVPGGRRGNHQHLQLGTSSYTGPANIGVSKLLHQHVPKWMKKKRRRGGRGTEKRRKEEEEKRSRCGGGRRKWKEEEAIEVEEEKVYSKPCLRHMMVATDHNVHMERKKS